MSSVRRASTGCHPEDPRLPRSPFPAPADRPGIAGYRRSLRFVAALLAVSGRRGRSVQKSVLLEGLGRRISSVADLGANPLGWFTQRPVIENCRPLPAGYSWGVPPAARQLISPIIFWGACWIHLARSSGGIACANILGGKELGLRKGDFIYVPRVDPHGSTTAGQHVARMVIHAEAPPAMRLESSGKAAQLPNVEAKHRLRSASSGTGPVPRIPE